MDKKYRIFTCTILVAMAFVLFLIPYAAYAEVKYENKTFTQSVTLKQINQPYYFKGQNAISKGVTVIVEKGTQLFIEGNILVRGKFIFQGEKDQPIQIKRPVSNYNYQTLITLMGGELSATYMNVHDTFGLLDAYATSTVLFDGVEIENVDSSNGSSIITVFNNSLLNINNSSFKNITASNAIELFNQSFLSIKNSSFERAGAQKSIVVYDGQIYSQIASGVQTTQNVPRTNSAVSIADSSFDGGLATEHAIEIFNGAYAEIKLTRFENFESAAVTAFSSAQLEISGTVFSKNKIGIEAYNSFIKISESEIFGNTEQGAVVYGGTVDAANNWWGSDSGPHSVSLNPSGTGDMYVGSGQINPWKTSKPKVKVKCCSSVLFIPGMQGSRIYKKGILSENQLWEPNTTSDVSKLYLTADGYSLDKNLYFRDIIDRTNVILGGNDDIEIYKGLIQALNGLNYNYSIEDWQFSAYDWRMSPNSIVTEGVRYGDVGAVSAGQYKRMEDQIVRMAVVSKTGKVTLIAHSYGGLVSKRFLTYLAQRGKISLIDKVIFIGVPENGSPASLFALLHGDSQDIGNGYIVNKFTMRKFAQNMPSVYALLPKMNSTLIFGLQATNTIATSVPTISTITDMYKFLFKEISRPSTIDPVEINIPLIANKSIKQKIDVESTSNFVKPQTDPAFGNIEFYNILGVGLDTPESISYVKKPCVSPHTHPLLISQNCGLDHISNTSQLGDGAVIADDVFLPNSSNVDASSASRASSRWGEKYIFNIAEYNRKSAKNYSHASIASAPPIISTLMQIMLNNIGDYMLPAYMTRHGGVRMGGSGVPSSDSSDQSGSPESANSRNAILISDIIKNKRYEISASDAVYISAEDPLGNVTGVKFAALPLVVVKNPQVIPIQNTSPNSSIAHVGGSYYIHTEALPDQVSLRPDMNVLSSSVQNSSDLSGVFDFVIKEISPVENTMTQPDGNSLIPQYDTKILASFENIPITEYSTVEVKVDMASTTQVEMNVTDQYEDVYVNTVTYVVTATSALNAILVGSISDAGRSMTGNPVVGNAQYPDGASGAQSSAGSIDIGYLIGLIRTEIQKSGVRTNFKQRYVLKLNTIEKNYKKLIESKKRLARTYTKDTTASLLAIVKDLNRSRSLYYRGGMRKSEAAFLLHQFSRLSSAFGD